MAHYIEFSNGITSLDTLPAIVTGCSTKGCYVIAYTDDGDKISGFAPIVAPVNSKLVVSILKEWADQSFLFRAESITYPEADTSKVIISSGCNHKISTTTTTTEPNTHINVA